MENFIFYYTLFKDMNFARESMQKNSEFTKEFLLLSKELCLLEAQTFLNDEAKEELQKIKKNIRNKIDEFLTSKKILFAYQKRHLSNDYNQWRVLIGLMCSLDEWCFDTHFFELPFEKQELIFSENPVDGYLSITKKEYI